MIVFPYVCLLLSFKSCADRFVQEPEIIQVKNGVKYIVLTSWHAKVSMQVHA